jgi:O-acetyl-ADP-ribose deacetylase (regulator of RNase III)
MERAARVALTTVRSYVETNAWPERVLFVCYGGWAVSVYRDTWKVLFGSEPRVQVVAAL